LQTDVHYISEKFIILHNFWVVLTKGNSFQVTRATDLFQIPSQCQQVSLFHLNINSKEKLNLTNRKNRCGSQTPLKGYVFTVVVSGKLG